MRRRTERRWAVVIGVVLGVGTLLACALAAKVVGLVS